jgi:hypothetical protein
MILTNEQIRVRASQYATECGSIDGAINNDYNGYNNGWKDCTEHYKQLIEDGMKWQELYQTMDNLNKDKNEEDTWRDEEVELVAEKALKIAGIL